MSSILRSRGIARLFKETEAMPGRGVHFALTADDERLILSSESDEALMEAIDVIEDEWDEEYLCQTDKAWDAIHRCLTDGTLNRKKLADPLSRCVLGGRSLYDSDDYTISYVTAKQVSGIVSALKSITEEWLRERYDQLDPEDYSSREIGDDDFGYTWENFVELREFYRRAAKSHRAVIFTVGS